MGDRGKNVPKSKKKEWLSYFFFCFYRPYCLSGHPVRVGASGGATRCGAAVRGGWWVVDGVVMIVGARVKERVNMTKPG